MRSTRLVSFLTLLAGALAAGQNTSPMLLVLEKDDRALAVVDPATRAVLGRAPAGEDPHEVAVSGNLAFISNYGAFSHPHHTLSIVDVAARRALTPLDLSPMLAPHGLAVDKAKVYFTAEGSKVIGCYDPGRQKIEWILGTGQNRTHMLVVTPDARTIFAANISSDSISVFERDPKADASGWRQTAIPVGKGPEGFDVSPDGKELWAANSADGSVSIIDLASKKVTGSLDVHTKRSNRLKFTPDGKTVLISDLGTGDLVAVDAASRAEVHRLNLGRGCAGILIPPDGSVAYVAVSPDNNVAVIDLKTFNITGRIATGRGPDGMAWIPGQ
ncbi:MAG TPA: YncE family protein [Bryobacteraceae bacterium]|nr:YncE family protein [Bryobacteraceae bacterium]